MFTLIIPPRAKEAHKGDFGRILVIAGSEGMMGAAILSLRGALKSGVGLATVSCDPSFFSVIHCSIPEAMCKNRELHCEDLMRYDSIAIGPGLGISKKTEVLVRNVLEKYTGVLVIDADALNTISQYDISTVRCNARLILTPHEAEAARLLNVEFGAIREDRLCAAKQIAEKYAAYCVLKGSKTIVVSKDGETYINTTGNPGMATGGAGDVLSGVLASFSAQFERAEISIMHAVSTGVYIHGLAGDIAAGKLGEYGLTAGDIADCLPFAIKESLSMDTV
ncbi:MAG: NAD(P)H-hydrate dehydratase [Clostridia bacterium]|nr:NAD(P)H-hydrate dehydratase [Clostridia bacterium]